MCDCLVMYGQFWACYYACLELSGVCYYACLPLHRYLLCFLRQPATPTPIVNVIIIIIFFFLLLLLHLIIIIIIIFCVSSLDLGLHPHHFVMVRIISVVFIQIVAPKVFFLAHLCIFFVWNFLQILTSTCDTNLSISSRLLCDRDVHLALQKPKGGINWS